MSRERVYGGNTFVDGIQRRVIVAASSWKEAAQIVGERLGTLRNYWSVTGNAVEIAVAMSEPHQPFVFIADSSAPPRPELYHRLTT